jgi:CRP-like cAMP-binding protein
VAIRFKPHDGEIIHVTDIHDGDVFGWSAALGRQEYTSCALSTSDDVFGWSAALGRQEYTSCALSTSDSEMVCIRGKDLREICTSQPEIGVVILERLAAVIAERLRNTHTQVVDLLWQSVNENDKR